MNSIAVASVVFACVFGSMLLALFLARFLPEQHLSGDSRDTVKQGLGLIATLSALVLGLLVASAKSTYDTQNGAVKQMAATSILLDRALDRYGPETKEPRQLLLHALTATVNKIWPEDSGRAGDLSLGEARADFQAFYDAIADLNPTKESQRTLRGRALDLTTEIAQIRLRLFAQRDSSIPLPFLVVLVLWLVILFAGFGLLAPRNLSAVIVLLICTVSVASAVFLILELDKPFEGVMRVPSAPMKAALEQIGK